MAKKKNNDRNNNNINDDVERAVKRQAKKTVKKHWKAIAITLAVIALVLIITFIALYIFKPELIQSIIDLFKKPEPFIPDSVIGANGLDEGTLDVVLPTTNSLLEMTMVDVGQGDGIVIELPDERVMYIDGGCRKGTFNKEEIFSRMDAVLQNTDKMKSGSKQIDYLMVTHADYDHILSLPLLFEKYEVINICFPRIADEMITKTWNQVYNLAKAETYTNSKGETVQSNYKENIGNYMLGGKIWKMECYSYKEEDYPEVKESSSSTVKNEISPICVLEYAQRSIVLTGDATKETEEYILGQESYFRPVDVDVLKVGHHGARESTSMQFLEAIDAEYALISCATTDYGHPHKELLDRIDQYTDVKADDDFNGFKETFITRDDGNVVVDVHQNGKLTITSTNNDSKNIEDTRVIIDKVDENVQQYAIITKEEEFERQYTLNCA